MNRLQRTRPLLASAVVLLTLAAPVRAQVGDIVLSYIALAPADSPPEAPTAIPSHLVRALGAASAAGRADALHAVVTLAYSAERVDLQPATPTLLTLFQTDPDARNRILALRALEASASEGVMEALWREAGRETVRARDPQEQRLLFWVLVGHYGVDALRGHADALVESLRADR